MRALFAIDYPSAEAAKRGLEEVRRLGEGEALALVDAVIATRGPDGAVKLDQSVNTAAFGALSGAFWGSLIGLIFLAPLIGAAVGAGAGAITGYATDYGISDDFMRRMAKQRETPGATLFVLAATLAPDKVAKALAPVGGEVIYTSMPEEAEARFKATFAPPAAA